MQLFFDPQIDQTLILHEEEARHAIKVLRHRIGDHLMVTNGKGFCYKVEILSDKISLCSIKIIETFTEEFQRDFSIHIAIAPTKNNDRIEWFVEKAIELGVDKITFLETDHLEKKHFKTDRIHRVAISALKQSLKYTLPEISEITDFKKFISQEKAEQKFIANLDENRKELIAEIQGKKSYCILIGPEGDFSKSEIQTALEKGFIPVSLGNYRLRTETAGLAACHTFHLKNALL